MSARRNAMPVLYTSGTHYEVGFDVGQTFSGKIKDFLGRLEYFQKELLPSYKTEEGRQAYEISLKTAEERFPQYVHEIRGTAKGAGVAFEHLMLLHLGRIVQKAAGLPSGGNVAPMGCSTICSNYDGQVLLGHTEDALPETLNCTYIVSAHIKEEEEESQGRYKTRQEDFTALCYPGYLPGLCMGYNKHGFVFSINVLFPTVVVPGKSAPYFLTRALLGASSFLEAETILMDSGVGVAGGFSVNMCFSTQKGDSLFYNAEVGPAVGTDESRLSVLPLSPKNHYLHANSYLRLDVSEDKGMGGPSSSSRHKRARECPPPKNMQSLLYLLSDTENADYPFFREGGEPDPMMTVTMGVFDLLEKTWTLWMKNPRTCDPIVTLPLTYKWEK